MITYRKMFPVWQQCICGIAEHFSNIRCMLDAAVEIGIIRDVNRHHHLHFIEVVKTFFFGFFVVGELGIFIKQFLNFQTYGIGYGFSQFNEFIQSVYKLLDSWFSSNRALGVIWMLPVSALAMKIAFRKGARKLNLNLVEYFLVRTYAACQIFIVSILLLPLSKDPEDSLPWWLYFIFSFWINLQLFNDKIKTTFFRTVLMYVYLILILILLALFLASILVFILWIFN